MRFHLREEAIGNRAEHFAGIDALAVAAGIAIVAILILFGIVSSTVGWDRAALRASIVDGRPSSAAVQGPAGFSADSVPAYSGSPSVEINGNVPFFGPGDLAAQPFEAYSDLDSLGRCGTAFALVGPETMPTSKRGSIGMVRPSGWQIAEYDWIDGRYLYNRCHLIAFALAAENENPLNLITGTRSMNIVGMLPYEERVASYIDRTRNHVLYRVTPVFEGDNLLASGVLMEAESVEDAGKGICFCVWCYNVEPGVDIDYATGANRANGEIAEQKAGEASAGAGAGGVSGGAVAGEIAGSEDAASQDAANPGSATEEPTYILNVRSNLIHYPDCSSVADMSEKNKLPFYGTRDEAIAKGYKPCGRCNP